MQASTGNPARMTSERLVIEGGRGSVELVLDLPAADVRGVALVGHPHPLYGGNLDNKVVATVARTLAALGWIAARPNFRGVGASAGTHDDGEGETQDFLQLLELVPRLPQCRARMRGSLSLVLAGFSFGAYVAARAADTLVRAQRPPSALVLVGTPARKWPVPAVPAEAVLIHGELDETIPLADVLPWARTGGAPVIVVPGADHFFHRRLGVLKRLVAHNLLGALAAAQVPALALAAGIRAGADE